MSWQLAIGLSVLANVVFSLVQRHYSIRTQAPSSFPPAISYLLGVLPIGVMTGLILPHHIHWSWQIFMLFIANSITIAIANWMLFSAVRKLPVVQFQIINQFYEVAAIVLGWIFLHESLTGNQTLGAVLMFISALLAIKASSGHRTEKIQSLRPIVIAAVGAFLFGASLVIEKAALGRMDIGAYLIFGWGAQTITMLLLAFKDANRHTVRAFGLKEVKWSAFMGWFNGAAGALYIAALVKSNNISLITAIAAIALPLIAIGAYLILKERENLRLLWASVILSTVGLVFTAFQ